jgi:hypothetical protein
MFEECFNDVVDTFCEISVPVVPLIVFELWRVIVHDVGVEEMWEFVYGAL